MRLVLISIVSVSIIGLAVLAYAEQEALLFFVNETIGTMPPHISALMIIAWVGIGTIILVPNSVLFVTSGTLFGFWWALTFNIIGFGVGSTLAFIISRYGFYEWVRAKAHTMLQTFNQRFSDQGWKAVAFVRLTPLFPSPAVNYLLGITHVRFLDYVWASIIFTIPACLVFTFLGNASIALLLESNSEEHFLEVISVVVIAIAAAIVYKLRKHATSVR